jgi:hypothetical protein
MTAITVTAALVAGNIDTDTRSLKAAETITAGQALYKTTAGLLGLCATGTSGKQQFVGIALTGGAIGDPIRYGYEGPVEGFALAGNVDTVIYASDTAGGLDTAAGTMTVPVGRVDMREDGTKFLWVDTAHLTKWS